MNPEPFITDGSRMPPALSRTRTGTLRDSPPPQPVPTLSREAGVSGATPGRMHTPPECRSRIPAPQRAAARTMLARSIPEWIHRTVRLLMLALGLALAIPALRAATFTAELDRTTVAVGESATLALLFRDGSPDAVPNVPSQPNLNISYRGQRSQHQFINGRTTAIFHHEFTLMASQPGTYTIPAISASIAGRIHQSKPLQLTVVRETSPNTDGGGPRLAFLRMFVAKTNVYLGEVLPIELRLYYLDGQNIQYPQLSAEGFTLGKMAEPNQGTSQVGQTMYRVVVFRWVAIAAREGNLAIGPAELTMDVRIRQRPRREATDPFDMFGLLDSSVSVRRATLKSDPVPILVKPLPADSRPPSFSGAVGTYAFSMTCGPTNVSVGDPITLQLRITGKGNLDAVGSPLPSTGWEGFKSYPPTAKTELSDPLGAEGTKVIEQIVVPERESLRQVPEVLFSYFDPERGAYTTLRSPPRPITVRPGSAQTVAVPTQTPGTTNTPPRSLAEDIAPIRTHPGVLANAPTPWLFSPGYFLLQAGPALLLGLVVGWRRYQERLSRDPKAVRKRRVDREIRTGLAELSSFTRAAACEEFTATALRLLQQTLGERLDIPDSAITDHVIEERLRPAGADPALLDELSRLFTSLNHLRYAPERNPGNLEILRTQLETLLPKLRTLHLGRGR